MKRLLPLFAVVFAFAQFSLQAAEDPMRYIPENSCFVIKLDLKQLLSSALASQEPVKAGLEQLKTNPQFKQASDVGIDPLKELDTIIMAGENVEKDQFVMILTGTFDTAKVLEKAKTDIKDEKLKLESPAPGVLLLGQQNMIDSAKAAKGPKGSPLLETGLALVNTQKTLLISGALPPELKNQAGNMPPAFQTLKGAGLALDLTAGLDLQLTGRFGSPADAQTVKAMMDESLKSAPLPPQVQEDTVKAVKVDVKDADATLSFTLTVDQIMKQVGSFMGGVAPGAAAPPAPEK